MPRKQLAIVDDQRRIYAGLEAETADQRREVELTLLRGLMEANGLPLRTRATREARRRRPTN